MTREQVFARFFVIAETEEGFEIQDPQTGGSYFIPSCIELTKGEEYEY